MLNPRVNHWPVNKVANLPVNLNPLSQHLFAKLNIFPHTAVDNELAQPYVGATHGGSRLYLPRAVRPD